MRKSEVLQSTSAVNCIAMNGMDHSTVAAVSIMIGLLFAIVFALSEWLVV